jgi:hypothetical protein
MKIGAGLKRFDEPLFAGEFSKDAEFNLAGINLDFDH